MIVPKERFGAVLRAVRDHRGETQLQVASRFPGVVEPVKVRGKVAEAETGANRATTVSMRLRLAGGYVVPRETIDALAEGRLSVDDAAAAFSVPVSVIAAAVEAPAQEAVSP